MPRLGRYLTGFGLGLGLLASVGCVSLTRDSSGTVRTFSTTGQGMRHNERAGTAEIDSPPATFIAPGYPTWPYSWTERNSNQYDMNGCGGRFRP